MERNDAPGGSPSCVARPLAPMRRGGVSETAAQRLDPKTWPDTAVPPFGPVSSAGASSSTASDVRRLDTLPTTRLQTDVITYERPEQQAPSILNPTSLPSIRAAFSVGRKDSTGDRSLYRLAFHTSVASPGNFAAPAFQTRTNAALIHGLASWMLPSCNPVQPEVSSTCTPSVPR